MRTNIVIDDRLMSEAMAVSGVRTKRDAVEMGLRLLVKIKHQAAIRELRGIGWTGDLEAMRLD
jgi:Arc/MetJ family transcription regulator